MTTSTIKITYGGDTITLTCDLSQASAPLEVDGEQIGYQTADARHRRPLAVALAARFAWPDATWPGPWGGSVPEDWADGCEAWDALEYRDITGVVSYDRDSNRDSSASVSS